MTTQGAGAMPAQGEGVSTFRALENRTGSNRLPERKGSRTSKMGLLPAGIGTPDARKRACPVRGALDGNLLSKGSKALSFDPGPQSPSAVAHPLEPLTADEVARAVRIL